MRTQIIYPSINSRHNEANVEYTSFDTKKISKPPQDTTDTGLGSSYSSMLPYSMNIFTAISKSFSLDLITDSSVKEEVLQILNALNEAVVKISDTNSIDRYLSRLHLVEQEDESILIEWIYRNFRIGFVVCKPVEESYYFFISQSEDSFDSRSSKIGGNLKALTHAFAQYVIENT
jgi:hypothetical protein